MAHAQHRQFANRKALDFLRSEEVSRFLEESHRYFLIRKKLSNPTIKQCLVLLFMGALQGFFGWYMVKSGLIDRPDVSHYRLALHLTTAFITFGLTLWVVLNLMYPEKGLGKALTVNPTSPFFFPPAISFIPIKFSAFR